MIGARDLFLGFNVATTSAYGVYDTHKLIGIDLQTTAFPGLRWREVMALVLSLSTYGTD